MRSLGPQRRDQWAVEAVSFDDTLRKIKEVVSGDLSEERTIPVNLVEMYEPITEFRQMIGMDRTAQVVTKYKTMDQTVRPVATSLPKDNWECMKRVATDPRLRDPTDIGHRFTDVTLWKLKIGGGGQLDTLYRVAVSCASTRYIASN